MQVNVDPIVGTIISIVGTALMGGLVWGIKTLASLKTDIEVMKIRIVEALNLRQVVQANGENLIRMDERQKKIMRDMDALHNKQRQIMSNH